MAELVENAGLGFEVEVGGTKMEQSDPCGLQTLVVEDHVEMIGVAHLTFAFGSASWSSFKLGDDVSVAMRGSDRKLFVGVVTGMRHYWKRGVETLTLTAMDPLCKLAASRQTKTYEEVKDSDVVSAVLGDAGVSSGTIDSTSVDHEYILQRNESHLAFLKRLAARNGYLLLANEGKVDFVSAQFSGQATDVEPGTLEALDYSFSSLNLPAGMTVYGWDYVTKERVEGTAGPGDIDTIGGGTNAANASGELWSGESYISDVHVSSQSAAKGVAVAEYNRLARNFLKGKMVVQGDANFHAGGKVKLNGLQEGFNPEGYIVSTRHVMDESGYHTEIYFCSNTLPE